MKSLLLLCSIGAILSTTNTANNLGFSSKIPLKASEITSFNDFIYKQDAKKEYYGNITGLKGEELILALEDVISKDNMKPNYGGSSNLSGGGGDWTNYFLLDRDFDMSPLTNTELSKLSDDKAWWQKGNIYMEVMYETEPIKVAPKPNGNGNVYNREHVYPKSHGFNDGGTLYKDIIAGCDMHNLHTCEVTANIKHKNLPYGDIKSNKEDIKSKITNKVNTHKGTSDGLAVFEPGTHEKGDIARSIFYMATRYHTYRSSQTGRNNEELGEGPRLVLANSGFSTTTRQPSETINTDVVYGRLNDLLEWSKNDSVSTHEEIRNTLCQKYVQGNRNPFIDYPLWVDACFNPDTKYLADINKPNGVRLQDGISLVEEDAIWDSYPKNTKINLGKIKVNRTINGTTSLIDPTDISFVLTNKDTALDTAYTSADVIALTTPGNYALTIKQLSSDLTIIKDFIVENYNASKFIGEISDAYEGDTLKISNFKTTKLDGQEFQNAEITYKLYDRTNKTEETLTTDKVLKAGEYYLSIYSIENELEYKCSSDRFEVLPLQDSVTSKYDIKEAKVGDKIDINSLTFSYIRNKETINVPLSDLTVTLTNTTTNEPVDLTKITKYEKEGTYCLKVDYKVEDKYKINSQHAIEVTNTPFWETKAFKIGVIAGCTALGVILLVIIIVLIVKKH